MLRLIAVATLALVTMASPALAHSHHHHHHHHHHHSRIVRHRRHRQDRDAQGAAQSGSPIPALVKAAASDLGHTAAQLGVRSTLWCMAAVNHWLHQLGLPGTGSDAAFSALSLGPHLHRPVVGTLAVMRRSGGGHIGVVAGVTPDGDPILISGNHYNRVARSVYPKRRIIAYVVPRRS